MAYDDLADLMPSASPLASNGIDPDDAVANKEQAMAQIAAKQNGMAHPTAATSGTTASATPNPLTNLAPPATGTPGTLASYVAAKAGPPATDAPNPVVEDAGSPSVPGVVTPTGKPDYYQQGQQGLLAVAQQSQQNASRFQNRPLPSSTTDLIEQARLKAATPTPLYGQDGKVLPQYRPSVGQRIARGIQAFGNNGLAGVLTANYGAPNDAYRGQENARAAQVQSLDQQMKYRQDANKADIGQIKDVGTTDNAAAGRFSDLAKNASSQQDADSQATRVQQTSPQGIAATTAAKSQAELKAANDVADSLKLSPQERKMFLANGKIPEPSHQVPSAELQAYLDLKAAATRENGGKPLSAKRLSDIAAQSRGKGGEGTTTLTPNQWQGLVNQHDREYQAEQRELDAALKTAMTPDEQAAAQAQHEVRMAALQDRWNQRYAQADPEGKYANSAGGSDNTAPAPQQQKDQQAALTPVPSKPMFSAATPAQASKPAAATKRTPALTPTGAWQGLEAPKSGEVPVITPSGDPAYIPKANLAKALARGYKTPTGAQ